MLPSLFIVRYLIIPFAWFERHAGMPIKDHFVQLDGEFTGIFLLDEKSRE